MCLGFIKRNLFWEKPHIPMLVFWVGTKCSLKCANCCNLIPYVKQKFFNVDDILADLKKLAAVATIDYIQIQGGEPLLHPELDKIISVVSSLNIKKKSLTTNGTATFPTAALGILKKSDNEIKLTISSYKCADNLRSKLIKQLDDNNIKYSVYDFMYGNGLWFDNGGVNTKRNNDDKYVSQIYATCGNKVCNTLANGKLTICGRAAVSKDIFNIKYFNKYDEINVRKIRSKIVLKYNIHRLYSSKFKEYCRYCLGTSQTVAAGIQLNEVK